MTRYEQLMALAASNAWETTPVARQHYDRVKTHLPKRGRAVDLGCGGAVAGRWLQAQGLQTTCVDASEAVCQALNMTTHGLDIWCMDAASQTADPTFDVADTTFDVIVCHGLELAAELSLHIERLCHWGDSGSLLWVGDWVAAGEDEEHDETYTRAGIDLLWRMNVSLSDWLEQEFLLSRRVSRVRPQSLLSMRLQRYLEDALPQMTYTQHFRLICGRIC